MMIPWGPLPWRAPDREKEYMMAAVDETSRREAARREFVQLLSIPSISSLPEHAGDVRAAAEWVAGRLTEARVDSSGWS